MATQAAIAAQARQFVTLGIDREVFAVSVDAVREILEPRPFCHIPNAPNYFLGIIDVRNHSVPVLDLRVKLGLPAIEPNENSRILVLDICFTDRTLSLGLLVDKVFEVTALDEQEIEPTPEIGERWRSEYISGVGKRSGEFVVILNVERLLAGTESVLTAGC